METTMIGVIVPVYKTEEYVAECIESILAQTHTNFRLILVDDGSPDGAGAICDNYAKKDNRITVIHQENAGVTRARAKGVEEAHDCEWITFVDSDDTITANALEELYGASNDKIDIVISNITQRINKISNDIETYRKSLICGNSTNSSPWGKLFRYNLFSSKIFDIPREIVVGEDMLMNIRISFKSNKDIKYISNSNYNYRVVQTSAVHTFQSNPEYEYNFQKELLKSIPAEHLAKYFTYTIDNRIGCYKRFWEYKYIVKDMKKTKFYQELESDIRRTNYKQPFIDSIIFKSTNPVIRFFAINIKKLINKFK